MFRPRAAGRVAVVGSSPLQRRVEMRDRSPSTSRSRSRSPFRRRRRSPLRSLSPRRRYRADGWTCIVCNTLNKRDWRDCIHCFPGGRKHHRRLRSPLRKSCGTHIRLFWKCGRCRYLNFSNRATCKECRGAASHVGERTESPQNLRLIDHKNNRSRSRSRTRSKERERRIVRMATPPEKTKRRCARCYNQVDVMGQILCFSCKELKEKGMKEMATAAAAVTSSSEEESESSESSSDSSEEEPIEKRKKKRKKSSKPKRKKSKGKKTLSEPTSRRSRRSRSQAPPSPSSRRSKKLPSPTPKKRHASSPSPPPQARRRHRSPSPPRFRSQAIDRDHRRYSSPLRRGRNNREDRDSSVLSCHSSPPRRRRSRERKGAPAVHDISPSASPEPRSRRRPERSRMSVLNTSMEEEEGATRKRAWRSAPELKEAKDKELNCQEKLKKLAGGYHEGGEGGKRSDKEKEEDKRGSSRKRRDSK